MGIIFASLIGCEVGIVVVFTEQPSSGRHKYLYKLLPELVRAGLLKDLSQR